MWFRSWIRWPLSRRHASRRPYHDSGAGGLGSDLGNGRVTHHHSQNPGSGPNYLQNFPLLTAVLSLGNFTLVSGSLHSDPNSTYTLDFYASAQPDPSGFGGGPRYLGTMVVAGSLQVTTDKYGNGTFFVVLAAATTRGEVVSATAIDVRGDTSAFSPVLTVGRLRFPSGSILV